MMDKTEVKAKMRNFIAKEFLSEAYPLKDNDSLFDLGIIDSLGLIKVTAFIEENFRIVINPIEITIEKFNTLEKITDVIYEKQEKNG